MSDDRFEHSNQTTARRIGNGTQTERATSGGQVGATDGRTQFSKPCVGDEHIYVGGLGRGLRCYPRGEDGPDPEWQTAGTEVR